MALPWSWLGGRTPAILGTGQTSWEVQQRQSSHGGTVKSRRRLALEKSLMEVAARGDGRVRREGSLGGIEGKLVRTALSAPCQPIRRRLSDGVLLLLRPDQLDSALHCHL